MRIISKFSPTLSALAVSVLCTPVLAQSADSTQPQQLQRVEVTGSHIKRIEKEGATPLTLIRREEIRATGATTITQLLDKLPSASTNFDTGRSNSFAPGSSSVGLRGLGQTSTLILLNFRRVAPFALADYNETFVNLDSLPLEAVERVEVVKNGGSSLYGSDAVAGVINIITRKDFQGLLVKGSRYQASKTAKFGENSASITGGYGDITKQSFNVLGSVEVFERDGVPSWRPLLDDVNPKYKAKSPSFGTGSTYAYPGNLEGVQGLAPMDGCKTVTRGLCMYDRYERFQVQPASKRVNGIVSLNYRLGELDGYAEAIGSRTETAYDSAFQPYGIGLGSTTWGNPQTNEGKVFFYRGLPKEHPLNKTGYEAELRYRFVDGNSSQSVTADQYRVLTGLRGVYKDLDWDLAVGVMGGKATQSQSGSFSEKGFKEVIGDPNVDVLAPDFFNKPNGYKLGQANSAAVLAKLFPTYGYTGKTQQTFFDAKLSGEVGRLPAGPVGMALGFDLRRESMTITPTDNLRTGDIVGYGVSMSKGTRNFGAAFAEFELPLTKTLSSQLAARVDKFPGFGAHVSPKAALTFRPVKELMLRGTLESGFRAPNLTETAQATKFAFQSVTDDKRCKPATALVNDLLAQMPADGDPVLQARIDNINQNECGNSVAIVTKNNPKLKPETSRIASFGAVFEPTANLSLSLDYYRIERKAEIGTQDPNDLLVKEASLPAGTIVRSSLVKDLTFTPAEIQKYGVTVGRAEQVVGMFENIAKTRTSGLDLSVRGQKRVQGLGVFGAGLEVSYLLDFKRWSEARNGWGDNLAGRYDYSRTTYVGSLSHSVSDWAQSLRMSYQGAQQLRGDFYDTTWTEAGCKVKKLQADECRIAPSYTFDYSISYSGIKNLGLGLNVINLLNDRPSVDYRDFGVPSGIVPVSVNDVKGRQFKVWAQYKFF
ncbi:TonB-dependent receptor plug domain-containing protein [Roseateles sp. BYS180W]|uniref:TonB-dependent receptor plug domain-containing protein n=1 Tax=Roseateles rivi TaxID=3299028 RepID=A0ABW7FWV2_9BURK